MKNHGIMHTYFVKRTVRLLSMVVVMLVSLFTVRHLPAWAGELENKVKAAYIYNFTKFVDWPGDGSNDTSEPVKICFVGSDPLRTLLGELNNREVKGRPLKIVRFKELNSLESCKIVFISRSEEPQLPQILQRLQGTHVLTVSDIPGFAHKGGMISFVTENDRVKIEISQKAVRQAGLKVSAKLLEVARAIP